MEDKTNKNITKALNSIKDVLEKNLKEISKKLGRIENELSALSSSQSH